MPIPSNIPSFLLLLMITISSSTVPSASHQYHHHHHHHSLGAACGLTRHRALCIRSLFPFSNPSAGRSLHWWARAAVSVTVSETTHIYQYLSNVHDNRPSTKTKTMLKGKHINATLSDCVECFDDAKSQLHESLRELRELKPGGGFGLEMSNVETGVSAALTNQDTCYDEIVQNLKGPEARRVRSRMMIAMHCSSNALALINELAAEGGSN